MKLSSVGEQFIKHFESCKLIAYPDPATGGKPWTIGHGQTGPDIFEGVVWTQEYADRRFIEHILHLEIEVQSLLKVTLNQCQFDALMSFTYNLGADIDADDKAEGLGDSTLLKKVNACDFSGAANEFPKWNRGGGRILRGLTRRRYAERALFEGESLEDALRIGREAA